MASFGMPGVASTLDPSILTGCPYVKLKSASAGARARARAEAGAREPRRERGPSLSRRLPSTLAIRQWMPPVRCQRQKARRGGDSSWWRWDASNRCWCSISMASSAGESAGWLEVDRGQGLGLRGQRTMMRRLLTELSLLRSDGIALPWDTSPKPQLFPVLIWSRSFPSWTRASPLRSGHPRNPRRRGRWCGCYSPLTSPAGCFLSGGRIGVTPGHYHNQKAPKPRDCSVSGRRGQCISNG